MPTVQANGIDIYYEVQGEGEPHAPIYEDVDGFNQRTLAFPQQHSG